MLKCSAAWREACRSIAERIKSETQTTESPLNISNLSLCAARLCESCHLNDMPEPSSSPQEGLRGRVEVVVVLVGSRSSVLQSQVTGEQKKRRRDK